MLWVGDIYYLGEKNESADARMFQCFSFTVAADKHGFYLYGKPFPIFILDVKVKNIKFFSDHVVTDKKSVWFVKLESEKLDGINGEKATVKDSTISDGVNTWQCSDFKSGNEPMYTKVAEQ